MTHNSTLRDVRNIVAALTTGLATAAASGQTITVNTLFDLTDFAAPQNVFSLPGPDGRISLKEACIAANNTAGPQTIEVAIPTSEFWLLTNMALIELEVGPFVLTDDGTTIDFSTQCAGDAGFNGTADFDRSGCIELGDLAALLGNFGA